MDIKKNKNSNNKDVKRVKKYQKKVKQKKKNTCVKTEFTINILWNISFKIIICIK